MKTNNPDIDQKNSPQVPNKNSLQKDPCDMELLFGTASQVESFCRSPLAGKYVYPMHVQRQDNLSIQIPVSDVVSLLKGKFDDVVFESSIRIGGISATPCQLALILSPYIKCPLNARVQTVGPNLMVSWSSSRQYDYPENKMKVGVS